MTRLNIPYNRIGRLTYAQFDNLYVEYKKLFDLEMLMTAQRTTYEKLEQDAFNSESWF